MSIQNYMSIAITLYIIALQVKFVIIDVGRLYWALWKLFAALLSSSWLIAGIHCMIIGVRYDSCTIWIFICYFPQMDYQHRSGPVSDNYKEYLC